MQILDNFQYFKPCYSHTKTRTCSTPFSKSFHDTYFPSKCTPSKTSFCHSGNWVKVNHMTSIWGSKQHNNVQCSMTLKLAFHESRKQFHLTDIRQTSKSWRLYSMQYGDIPRQSLVLMMCARDTSSKQIKDENEGIDRYLPGKSKQ